MKRGNRWIMGEKGEVPVDLYQHEDAVPYSWPNDPLWTIGSKVPKKRRAMSK